MLSDMLSTGAFHNRAMTIGGVKAMAAKTVQPVTDPGPTATAAMLVARIQTAPSAIFVYW
jgi:hypothetical protein